MVKEIGTGRTLGEKRYELSNHLGNVLTVISDKKVEVGSAGITDHYMPDIISSQDYYAFGAPLDNHGFSPAAKYRYGFNGKENDIDINDNGDGAQDYGMRVYNPSLGKFFSKDPLSEEFPFYTPYQFAGNKPTWAIDIDGKEEWYYWNIYFGWQKSLITGSKPLELMNSHGFYTANQKEDVKASWDMAAKEIKDQYEADIIRENAIQGAHDYEMNQNPFYLIGKFFTPAGSVVEAIKDYNKGDYWWAGFTYNDFFNN